MRLLYKQKIETEELQMKKFLAMLLVAAMVFSMAACAKAPEAAQPAATEETAGETAETAEAPKDGKVYKVAMICDSSISDGGWGMSCYNAMMDAAEKHGWETAVSDSIEQSAYFDTIDSYCTLGYDMIYAPGNQYTDAVLQAAAEYPDIAFALLNGRCRYPRQGRERQRILPAAQRHTDRLDRRRSGRPYDRDRHHRLYRRHGAGHHQGQV